MRVQMRVRNVEYAYGFVRQGLLPAEDNDHYKQAFRAELGLKSHY
jgi:hypothetical protein